MKYDTLVKILDRIADEAPNTYKSYKSDDSDIEKQNQIRAKAMIHLFLMVRFGIQNFEEREKYITDGPQDGGIDAYFIEEESKKIYIIQSKFRTNEKNYENAEITLDELVKMEIGRVVKGEEKDTSGNEYNGKIKGLQRNINQTPNLGLYDYQVVLLCNLNKYNDLQITRLVDNFKYEVFNFENAYNKLVFPLLISTYFDPTLLDIKIHLDKKSIPNLRQEIPTKYGKFEITVVFVPTYEIAKAMAKYKNALLVYNPRNYLSLAKNPVNQEIRKSILECETGEFAIFNNGVTIFADSCGVNNTSGRKDEGIVTITKPQIINGGQTVFTLSKLYEEGIPKEVFTDKEVMLKIITPCSQPSEYNEQTDIEMIKKISRSTNQQSKIEEADMRSNENIQIDLQKAFYSKYGALYERKKGEFEEAITRKFIKKEHIINREDLLKAYWSFKGNPGRAKNSKIEDIFESQKFNEIIDKVEDIDKMHLSYILFKKISLLEVAHKKKDYNYNVYGNALRYGKNAMIYMYSLMFKNDLTDEVIDSNIQVLLKIWPKFDEFVVEQNQNESKTETIKTFNYFNYYRNTTLNKNIEKFVKLQ